MSGVSCLLPAGCLLTKTGAGSFLFRQAMTPVYQKKRGPLLSIITPQRGRGDTITTIGRTKLTWVARVGDGVYVVGLQRVTASPLPRCGVMT